MTPVAGAACAVGEVVVVANGERGIGFRRVAGLVAGVGVLGLLLGGVATATIPTSTSGQVAACYKVSGGSLRVIDVQKRQKCAAGERLLTWGPSWVWRGAYSPKVAYAPGSVVLVNGSSYVARVAVPKGRAPSGTGTGSWGLLAAAGATGPAGPAGPKGDTGPAGPAGGPIPSGRTVTGGATWTYQSTVAGSHVQTVQLPGDPGKLLLDTDVNFNGGNGPKVGDGDTTCTGSYAVPTAPPGKVCLYLLGSTSDLSQAEGYAFDARVSSFIVGWSDSHAGGNDVYIDLTWAYTAP